MAKQTAAQRHEVNRAEFRKWRAAIKDLQKRLRVVERLLVIVSNRTRARTRSR